ncbi:MAG: hypothetical protein ACJAZJ_000167 [Candidatus Endobugula sp.]|jgi:hypothetical protein
MNISLYAHFGIHASDGLKQCVFFSTAFVVNMRYMIHEVLNSNALGVK